MTLQYCLEWLTMLLRWSHVVAAIAWIGASFYFVWLDNSLVKPTAPDLIAKGVDGELWAVHGGGFYNPQKYLTAPPSLPEHLHWFYWESYATWMSGFGLFVLLYLLNAELYMIDPQILPMSQGQAVLSALGFLGVGWLVYDGLCRLLGFRNALLGLLLGIFIGLATLAATHIFAGRAAYLMIGAMMATMMSANVLFWIIPGQRKVIAAMRLGLPVDPLHGQRGKQRSVHNTYLTLPVIFCMLSNHFGLMYMHPYRGLILIFVMLAAVSIRQFFLLRHKGQVKPGYLVLGVVILLGIFIGLAPEPEAPSAQAGQTPRVTTEQAFAVVRERCYGCHALQPTLMGGGAPQGVVFENQADLEKQAATVYQQAVQLKAMPLGNITHITEEERRTLALWYQQRSSDPTVK